jgi:hypothetical protein
VRRPRWSGPARRGAPLSHTSKIHDPASM